MNFFAILAVIFVIFAAFVAAIPAEEESLVGGVGNLVEDVVGEGATNGLKATVQKTGQELNGY